ncbi:MAG: MoaD/ThiS family protein [Youngiibacter sp.]|nr:MoaD/ThiS family protein [Youngiibacter sp.]
MRIEMKYIGVPLAGMTNTKKMVILPEGSTVDALVRTLISENDGVTIENFKSVTFMVNKKNALGDTLLHDGDEVFLLGILGGG